MSWKPRLSSIRYERQYERSTSLIARAERSDPSALTPASKNERIGEKWHDCVGGMMHKPSSITSPPWNIRYMRFAPSRAPKIARDDCSFPSSSIQPHTDCPLCFKLLHGATLNPASRR